MILIGLLIVLTLELFVVGVRDFQTKKISNYWSLSNLIYAPFLYIFLKEFYPFGVEVFYYPLGFLVFGFVLFALKIMGAGDVKYLSTFFLLIPPSLHSSFFSCLLYSTVIVGLILLLINIVSKFDKIKMLIMTKDFSHVEGVFGKKFTFAPVVFMAWIWFVWIKQSYFF